MFVAFFRGFFSTHPSVFILAEVEEVESLALLSALFFPSSHLCKFISGLIFPPHLVEIKVVYGKPGMDPLQSVPYVDFQK